MRKKFERIAAVTLGAVFIMLTVTLPLLTRWALSTWANLTMDEIVYHLSAELGGVDANILRSLALTVLLPAIIAGTAALFFCRRKPLRMLLMSTALLLISTFSSFSWFNHQLDFVSWIRAQGEDSTFIADHYADPTAVQITFPEEKQNLIYIYLESMETTYADVASGGARSANLIPALTRIAQENEDFSGDSPLLGGGRVVGASSWTMAAMFAHTAGLPLKIYLDAVRGENHGLTMLDATGKKTEFLRMVCRELEISGGEPLQGRAEELGHDPARRESYDVVLSRAVSAMDKLDELCLPLCRVGGIFLALKSAAGREECEKCAAGIAKLGGGTPQFDPYQLPGDQPESLVVRIPKISPTPKAYPRAFGAIKKRPL